MLSLLRKFLFVPALASLLVAGVRAAEDSVNTIKFSDPSKPGTVKISLGHSSLKVQGVDTNEVSIKSNVRASGPTVRKDGLRVISTTSSFALGEKDNVITIDGASNPGKNSAEFQLKVPKNTSIVVTNAWNGEVMCSDLSGDVEIKGMNGEIKLYELSGGVLVEAMNGEITANLRELNATKPLSFTTHNGQVVLRLPESAKASLRLRTQNGAVLTDFPETMLLTKAEPSTSTWTSRSRSFSMKDGKVLTADVQEAIREAAALSATAVQEALEAVKSGIEEARINSEEARREIERARRDMERARREISERTRVARTDQAVEAPPAPPAPPAPGAKPVPPTAPVPPKITKPTITGGKLVTGTLNGGGVEINVATMNGDVVLRKR